MKNIEKYMAFCMLLFAIVFNLWIYRLEPTSRIDPNDNTFQFSLVDRTNQIWDFANKKCSNVFCQVSYLVDHWVPNWAEGYNLPYYYSHIPQILIVASYRLFHPSMSLFQYYHWVIYFLLSFFPLSVFMALRIIKLSWITAGIGALIASQISTDGFYGLDPASFLWRGYGLSSQLFAMIWLPLGIAYAWRGSVVPAIFMLFATSAGHLGIGIMAFLSVGIIAKPSKKLFWILGGAFLLLAYWIVPAYLQSNYHNFSVWDPIWKFNSYGAGEILKTLFNGDLFDFGRFPILTILVFLGLFVGRNFSLLFIFWLLMYFGRTTWGGLMDFIPGMSEFHQSRFIVGVHLAGLFLIPIAVEKIPIKFIKIIIVIIIIILVFPQTVRYAKHNDFLIQRANSDYEKVKTDVDSLLLHLTSYISARPGRVFAGRGGTWGRDFRVAETPYYLHLSTYGIPTVLWLPQTWSPNSDTEQYFSENRLEDYALYNIRYAVTPPKQEPPSFWKLLKEAQTWKLYEVETEGYITTGVRPAIVSSSKENFLNVVRLWIQSNFPKQGLYPELTFTKDYPSSIGLPNFRMLDEVTYKVPDGSMHNLFSEIPNYQLPSASSHLPVTRLPAPEPRPTSQDEVVAGGRNDGGQVLSQESSQDMIFRAKVEVKENCIECVVILKQTFHPSWRATIDGVIVKPFTVFPFFTAIEIREGTHEVVFSYQPSLQKQTLLLVSILTLAFLGLKLGIDKK